MSNADRKVEFIIAWYKNECTKLSFGDKIKLARIWIDICIKDEEYEMAAAIREEKTKQVKKHIKDKLSKRTFNQKINMFILLLKRKFKKIFNSK